MRPLKLTMQAFGPYAEKEEINFTELKDRTMFVISGKTGSGKTTIFDGISYAIYGKASGEDRNGPELRSQFAKNETLTEVSLEFTLRKKTYVITRSPQQERQKERGEGFRTIGAKAELYVRDDNGIYQLLAANVREVDEKIRETMIIDSNQFRQILMIPQGEFRKLLTSESKEKEVILQRLFHTQKYKRIEEKLKEDAAELKKAVERQVEDRDQAIKQIHGLFNEDLKSFLAAESVNDTLIMPLLQEEIMVMHAELGAILAELKNTKEERDKLQQKLYEAEAIVKQLNLRSNLAKRKAELESEGDRFEQIDKQINLAHKAALLAQQEEICHHLKKELDSANEELAGLRTKEATLANLLKAHEEGLKNERSRETERRLVHAEINRLQNLKADIHSLSFVQLEVGNLEKNLHAKTERKIQLEKTSQKIDQMMKDLVVEKQKIENEHLTFIENAHKLEKIDAKLERIKKYAELNSRQKQAVVLLETKENHLERFLARISDANNLVQHLEEKWLHGQASILAGQLHDGVSCPVCGSLQHPDPANSAEIIPDENDLKAAKQQLSELENEKRKAESAFFEAKSTVYSLNETVAEQLLTLHKELPEINADNLSIIIESIQAERTDLANSQSELAKKQGRRSACIQELEAAEKVKEETAEQLAKLLEEMNELTIHYTEKKTNLTRMIATIPEEVRSVSAFEERLQKSVEQLEKLEQQLEAAQKRYEETKGNHLSVTAKCEAVEKQAMKLAEQLKQERAAFLHKMHEQGFTTYMLYNEAKMSERQIDVHERSLRHYREEVRSVHDRYEELVELLQNIEQPNIEKLTEALKEIDSQINVLQDEYTNLLIKKKENDEITARINKINEQIKIFEERFRLIGDLSDMARGQNTSKITFERYVLATFLDDILQEANGRLRKMTSGRFELLRKTDRSKGNVQSGLELLVFDQYTGQERHVKTLSGGESFKAALALALGLSDVVQAFAGGVSLETMFIDEGFGTLDPESLDQAIEALIDIQSSGRLVGIISHVPELKERIDARLEVTATQSGSKTEFQFLS